MPELDLVEFGRRTARIRSALDLWLVSTWDEMGSWREADFDAVLPEIVQRVEAAQMRMATLTDLYLAYRVASATGTLPPLATVTIAAMTTFGLRGVPGVDLYMRPAATVWTALADGQSIDRAQAAGRERLRKLAATGVQLAKTRTAAKALASNDSVTGYRRVLNGRKNCGLCVVASTARYRRGDLLPIHPGCDCGVDPIIGDRDPGWIIEPDQLQTIHDTLQATFGASSGVARQFVSIEDEVKSYRDVLVVHQHGEIGPVLGVRGRRWRSIDEIQR